MADKPTVVPGLRTLMTDSAGTALDASVLPSAAGTWILTNIVNIRGVRELLVECQYDAHASTTTGYPLIRPWCSSYFPTPTNAPAITDDVWTGPAITDGVVTATALDGTKATGLVEAHGPLQGYQIHREAVIQPPAVVANSAKTRFSFTLKVAAFSWVMFEVAEKGDTTNRGKLRIYLTGVC